jgi:hypothetical protein
MVETIFKKQTYLNFMQLITSGIKGNYVIENIVLLSLKIMDKPFTKYIDPQRHLEFLFLLKMIDLKKIISNIL